MDFLLKIDKQLIQRDKVQSPEGQASLKIAYESREPVFCLCSSTSPSMHIRHAHGKYHLVKSKFTGQHHHPSCQSFDLDEHEAMNDENAVVVHPSFPLTQKSKGHSSREHPAPLQSTNSPIQTESLRGLLHTLWVRSELHKWVPKMKGKRTWAVVRTRLLNASSEIALGRQKFSEHLYIPQPFDSQASQKQIQEAKENLTALCSGDGVTRNLCLVLGIVKRFRESKFGTQVQLKHLPEPVFYLRDHQFDKLIKERPFEMGQNYEQDGFLFAILLVDRSKTGYYNVVDIDLVRMTGVYIPVSSVFEEDVICKLVEEQRSFIRSFKENAEGPRTIALLTDTDDKLTRISICLNQVSATIPSIEWLWNPKISRLASMPPLPRMSDGEKNQ